MRGSNKIAVIIYGPTGSGKGTQANLLADRTDILHLDTGRLLESIVHDPLRQRSKTVRRERKLFDTGFLMTPRFVAGEVMRKINRIARAGFGIALSGSPRTLYEAKRLLPFLEKTYGRKNIYFILLEVPFAISVSRNIARRICRSCGRPLLSAYVDIKTPKFCPVCGGALYKRSLDAPNVQKKRVEEYVNRTEPIFSYVKEQGYPMEKFDGRPAPAKVSEAIYAYLKKHGGN